MQRSGQESSAFVEIRRLKPEDAALAGALTLEYKRATYEEILPAERIAQLTLEHSIKLSRNLLKDPASHAIFAAFVSGEPAAISGASRLRWKKYVPAEYGGEIHTFYVKPEFRPRHRLADRLWSHMIDWLEHAGIEKAVAFVLEDKGGRPSRATMRGSRIIGVKPGDGLWEGHNMVIHAWDELKRPIPRSLEPELSDR